MADQEKRYYNGVEIDEYQYQQLQMIEDEANRMFESVEKIEEKSRFKMDEYKFRRVFFPWFYSDGKENPYDVTLDTWRSITGDVNQYVDIVDYDGNVIFSMPPLFDYTAITYKTRSRNDYYELVTNSHLISSQSVNRGNNFIQSEMLKRIEDNDNLEKMLHYLEDWNKILKYYNLPLVEIELPKPKEEKKEDGDDNTTEGSGIKWEF